MNKQTIENIDINLIDYNSNNPRKVFNEEDLKDLATSIVEYGILQPLILIKKDDRYEIVAGERRFRAAQLASMDQVPAIIKDLGPKDKDFISLIENIQRKDLNPYEEAHSYKSLMENYGLTQAGLSELIGKSRAYIANTVRLLSLDDHSTSLLKQGDLTSTQARALLSIKDSKERREYLDLLLNGKVSVNAVEKAQKRKVINNKDIYIEEIEDKLMEKLGSRVNIKKTKTGWTMNIDFYQDEDLENFLSNLEIIEWGNYEHIWLYLFGVSNPGNDTTYIKSIGLDS